MTDHTQVDLEPVVRLERLDGHIAVVTIDRPHAANAVTAEVARQLEAVVRSTEADEDVWAVILTGAGSKAFCAGADLKEVAAGNADILHTPEGGFAGFVHSRRAKPWIAAVNGAAVGGGCEIVLACDMVVAVEHAQFALPEVRRGLIAAAGGLYRLPRTIPIPIALELITTARSMSATEAHRWGLANRLASANRLLDEAMALARDITRNAPVAVRESLRVARQAFILDESELRELSRDARAIARRSDDYAEGARAFVEKREPRWKGR